MTVWNENYLTLHLCGICFPTSFDYYRRWYNTQTIFPTKCALCLVTKFTFFFIVWSYTITNWNIIHFWNDYYVRVWGLWKWSLALIEITVTKFILIMFWCVINLRCTYVHMYIIWLCSFEHRACLVNNVFITMSTLWNIGFVLSEINQFSGS